MRRRVPSRFNWTLPGEQVTIYCFEVLCRQLHGSHIASRIRTRTVTLDLLRSLSHAAQFDLIPVTDA